MEDRKTLGTEPAKRGALQVLQFYDACALFSKKENLAVADAADEIATYHPPVGTQASRHEGLSTALADFLLIIVNLCPPGPERSTAISRAREAKMWASAAIAMEGR